MLKSFGMILAVLAMAAPATAGTPCRDTKGKFVKCPTKGPVKTVRCKNSKGRFAKCGTPGAKPI